MNSVTDKEKLDKLVERIKHMQDRSQKQSDSFGKLDGDKHTAWGGWSKGYREGVVSACELLLDFIEHMNKE